MVQTELPLFQTSLILSPSMMLRTAKTKAVKKYVYTLTVHVTL